MKKYRSLIEIIAIGCIIYIIATFFFQLCFVRGESMEPSLSNGQMLIARKHNLNIKNDDIVVIKKDNKTIIKRVVGVPHDKVEIREGFVYVNGVQFDNRYTENVGVLCKPIVLLEGQYFVLGDNRSHSIDSRFEEIGIISRKEIIGIIK